MYWCLLVCVLTSGIRYLWRAYSFRASLALGVIFQYAESGSPVERSGMGSTQDIIVYGLYLGKKKRTNM